MSEELLLTKEEITNYNNEISDILDVAENVQTYIKNLYEIINDGIWKGKSCNAFFSEYPYIEQVIKNSINMISKVQENLEKSVEEIETADEKSANSWWDIIDNSNDSNSDLINCWNSSTPNPDEMDEGRVEVISDNHDFNDTLNDITDFCKSVWDNGLNYIGSGVEMFCGAALMFAGMEATVGGIVISPTGAPAIAIDALGVASIATGGVMFAKGWKDFNDTNNKTLGDYNSKKSAKKPNFVKENRVPLDSETALADKKRFEKTSKNHDKAAIYQEKETGNYYYRDKLHKGEGAHLEVFNKRGKHLGEADPVTGKLIPDTAVPGRKLNVK